MHLVTNPLEQFDIHIWCAVHKLISLSTFSLFLCLNLSLVIFLMYLYVPVNNIVYIVKKKTIFNFLSGLLLNLIIKILRDNLHVKKNSFLFNFYFIFLTILVSNIVGMLPSSYTITGHLIVTIFFSLSFFIGINIIGIVYHKEKFLAMFLPEGVPIIASPLIILIEYISYFSRVLSLAIRLFANMMSGHILMKILISFSWTILTVNKGSTLVWLPFSTFYTVISIFPFIIVLCVIFLEVIISFLQAYVFIVLLSIYLNDAINLH